MNKITREDFLSIRGDRRGLETSQHSMEEKNTVVKKANQFISRLTEGYEYRKRNGIKIPLNNEEVLNNVNKGLAGKNLLIALDYDKR